LSLSRFEEDAGRARSLCTAADALGEQARVVWVLKVIVGSLRMFRCTSASHRTLFLAPG
jgi:hypothetical protein